VPATFNQSTKKRDLPFRAARAGLARKIVVRKGLAPHSRSFKKDIGAGKKCQAGLGAAIDG
jgi:hypothetical protein